jgi:fatty acid desaturase
MKMTRDPALAVIYDQMLKDMDERELERDDRGTWRMLFWTCAGAVAIFYLGVAALVWWLR